MKFAALTFATVVSALISASAFAADKFVCTEYDRKTDKLMQKTVALYPLEKGEIKEGTPMKYSFELHEGADVSATTEVNGTVLTEDVLFNFTSDDGKIEFHIYMDEMNEAGLTINGKTDGSYICY